MTNEEILDSIEKLRQKEYDKLGRFLKNGADTVQLNWQTGRISGINLVKNILREHFERIH